VILDVGFHFLPLFLGQNEIHSDLMSWPLI
jgi:hypothetical protein